MVIRIAGNLHSMYMHIVAVAWHSALLHTKVSRGTVVIIVVIISASPMD